MGLFFFKKEIEREQFAQRLDALELRLEQIEKQQIALAKQLPLSKQVEFANDIKEVKDKSIVHEELIMAFNRGINKLQSKVSDLEYEFTKKIGNEVHKQIHSAKAVDKAHEKHPSLAKRMHHKKTRRVGTYAEKQFNEPFQIAWALKNSGYTRPQIANVLNAKGFKTPQLNDFNIHSVTDLMQNHHQKKQMEYARTKMSNTTVYQNNGKVDFLDGIQ